MEAAEAACDQGLREQGLRPPNRLFTRQEAWDLAHASERTLPLEDEMVDEERDD